MTMKPTSLALVAAAIVVLAGSVGAALSQGMPLAYLFLDAGVIAKLVMMLTLVALVVIVIAGLASRGTGSTLRIFGLLALGLSVAGFAFSMLSIVSAIRAVGSTPSFGLLAPGIAEALLVLGLGLLTAAAAAVLGDRGRAAVSAPAGAAE